MSIRTAVVTPDHWSDFEKLFGPTGQQGGCWCMWTRQTSREFDERKGEPNRQAMRELVATGPPPGLLAFIEDAPVGWVAVGPRESFSRLGRSPVTKPVDDTPVWSITCFVIDRKYRRRGVATALLDAAVRYAAESGAEAVEGYPVEARRDTMPDIYAWMGLAEMFEEAGFVEIARRSETRPIYRLRLDQPEK
jgi:ribosomal protein S18 acetylase RimI-like enzyme